MRRWGGEEIKIEIDQLDGSSWLAQDGPPFWPLEILSRISIHLSLHLCLSHKDKSFTGTEGP